MLILSMAYLITEEFKELFTYKYWGYCSLCLECNGFVTKCEVTVNGKDPDP